MIKFSRDFGVIVGLQWPLTFSLSQIRSMSDCNINDEIKFALNQQIHVSPARHDIWHIIACNQIGTIKHIFYVGKIKLNTVKLQFMNMKVHKFNQKSRFDSNYFRTK